MAEAENAEPRAVPRFGNVTIDTNDAGALVAFWTEAFGYEVEQRGDDWALLRDPAGSSPRILFQWQMPPDRIENPFG